MHVLVFLTFGISLQDWEKSGSLERELLLYRNIHKKYNIRFTFVSFGDEEDELLSGEFNVIPYYKYNRQLKSRFRTLVQSIFFSLKIRSLVGETDLIKPLIDIPAMSKKSIEMMRNCLKAYKTSDVKLAEKVCQNDDEVDGLKDRVINELLQIMMKDPTASRQATYLIFIAHNLSLIHI